MAIYVVTDNPETNWDEKHKYKYRYEAKDGSRSAQAEIDERKSQGKPAVLWRWMNGEAEIVELCNAEVLPAPPIRTVENITEVVPAPTDFARWKGVRDALDEFQSYLATSISRFQIVAANDSSWDDEEYKQLRAAGFPSRLRGIYLIYDWDDNLIYVGVGLVSFDKRVWSHDAKFEAREVERRWTDIIPLPDEYAFLALSLEFFLISRLNPKCNTAYKGYVIPKINVLV